MSGLLVTGAGGMIARAVAGRCSADGVRTVGVSRTGTAVEGFARVERAALGDSIVGLLERERPAVVIHAANHAGPDEYAINVEGTGRWIDEARAAGVELQILLSSLSAQPDAPADYGRAKFELERRVAGDDAVILRLGLVVGPGGMFGKMVDTLRRARVAPLLDGGRGKVHVIGLPALTAVLGGMVADRGAGYRGETLHAQQPEPYSLRETLETIRDVYGFDVRLVPVPSAPVYVLVAALERLGLTLPISTTNIRGLRRSQFETFPSDFDRFGPSARTLAELVAEAAAAG